MKENRLAEMSMEFSACGKCNIVACALTKRVAAVGVQRSRTVGKAHTASPQQDTGTIIPTLIRYISISKGRYFYTHSYPKTVSVIPQDHI